MRVARVLLRSRDAEASRTFLHQHFPDIATPSGRGASVDYVLGSDPTGDTQRAAVHMAPFWKISLFVDDVDAEVRSLRSSGVTVSEPVQFLDIGYLCHFNEPGGNEVELLQRTFKPPMTPTRSARPSGPVLGLVTLRVTDYHRTAGLLQQGLSMAHLATMEVNDGRPDPFRLDFFAYTDEDPPSPDPFDAANREWLYQRPYSIIELQHGPVINHLSASTAVGLSQIDLTTNNLEAANMTIDSAFPAHRRSSATDELMLSTPDGHTLRLGPLRPKLQ